MVAAQREVCEGMARLRGLIVGTTATHVFIGLSASTPDSPWPK